MAERIGKRKTALLRWAEKFDRYFVSHLNGEAGIEKIKLMSGLLEDEFVTLGQGGHRWNKNIKLKKGTFKIPNPPVDDLPYLANIEIKYRSSFLPKRNTSTMFPENWRLERIQEEVAWVYENTVAKGENLFSTEGKFDKYIFTNSKKSFNIIIEVNDEGYVINSYPKIN